MQVFGLIGLLITVAIAAWWLVTTGPVTPPSTGSNEPAVVEPLDPVILAEIDAHADLITLTSPQPNGSITSPLTLTGQARGTWYFEGSFPVILTDWDGRIIAESYATAQGEWMTEDFVPFVANFAFPNPYHAGDPDFMRRGSLILKKDNPSGLPENDDALEIPIRFSPIEQATPAQSTKQSYGEILDAAEEAARSVER
jgi:hypothetical protein